MAGLSAGWQKWDVVIMHQLGPVGTAIIERLGIAGDQQHLDIAAEHPPRSLRPDQHRSMINVSKRHWVTRASSRT